MNDLKPYVSVIVPIYNAEKYLRTTLNCIINQTLKNIEIILVNDGSKDKSLDICLEYAEKDKRVKVVDKKNNGVSSTRNKGIENAVGEYITFVDSDDIIKEDMYLTMYEIVKKYDADMVDCSYRTITRSGKNEIIYRHKHPKNVLLDKEYILKYVIPSLVGVENNLNLFIFSSVWNKLYKTGKIKENNIKFYEDRIKYEDRIFTVEFLEKANNIICVEDCFYSYIQSSDSLMSRYNYDEFNIVMKNQFRYKELYGKYLDFNKQSAVLYRINAITDTIFSILLHRKDERYFKEKIIDILQNSYVIDWYKLLYAKTIFYKLVKKNILSKKYFRAYLYFEIKYLPIRIKQCIKRILYKILK